VVVVEEGEEEDLLAPLSKLGLREAHPEHSLGAFVEWCVEQQVGAIVGIPRRASP